MNTWRETSMAVLIAALATCPVCGSTTTSGEADDARPAAVPSGFVLDTRKSIKQGASGDVAFRTVEKRKEGRLETIKTERRQVDKQVAEQTLERWVDKENKAIIRLETIECPHEDAVDQVIQNIRDGISAVLAETEEPVVGEASWVAKTPQAGSVFIMSTKGLLVVTADVSIPSMSEEGMKQVAQALIEEKIEATAPEPDADASE